MVLSPVGLDEHAVDVFEIDAAGLVAHGFNKGTNAEVASATQEAVAGAHDKGEGFGREDIVAKTAAIELVEDKGFDGFGREAGHECGVGDAGFDFLVDGKTKCLE